MKKFICLLAVAVLLVFVLSLRINQAEEPLPEPTPDYEPMVTVPPTPVPTASPEPDKLRVEGYTAQQIGDYFCEVALGVEYSHGSGDSSAVQKWARPIHYAVYGSPTQEDTALIESFVQELNSIEGFPEMYPADSAVEENFVIRFLPWEQMSADAGYVVNGEYADGIAYWDYYIDTNDLYNVRIWIRSDIDQYTRNSVIYEEIINSLGLGNDTTLREDSIIYQYYTQTQQPSEMDWLLLKILYNENMRRGMHEAECREVINQLCE
ncbi:MAG: DUF2927 domain-containing protein [Oscillospiraceae bacterium]|nr:DUF2927 domain-containing protein [Oscillospiraceae bacterium]